MTTNIVPSDSIKDKIHIMRGVQVILDSDIAKLYGVETRVLNQGVKRNIKRFPSRFRFQLTKDEFSNLISQNVISKHETTCKFKIISP